jgi:hypothetical protein
MSYTQFLMESNSLNHKMETFVETCKTNDDNQIIQFICDSNCGIFRKKAFYYCCEHNYIDVVDWMYTHYISKVSESSVKESIQYVVLFDNVIAKGHLPILKWIDNKKPYILQRDINTYMIYACEKGYLEIVKWLYSKCNKMENKPDLERVFQYSCYSENTETTKWVLDQLIMDLSIRPSNIDILLDFAFDIAFEESNIDLFHLLQIHRPFLYCKKNHLYEIHNNSLYLVFYEKMAEIYEKKLYRNDNIKRIDYELIQQRMNFIPEGYELSLKEELMRNRFHPKHMDKWVSWGQWDHYDKEDMREDD